MKTFTRDAETRRSEEKKIQKFAFLPSSSSLRVSAPPVNAFEKMYVKGQERRNGAENSV
jgi:hypothetical protein